MKKQQIGPEGRHNSDRATDITVVHLHVTDVGVGVEFVYQLRHTNTHTQSSSSSTNPYYHIQLTTELSLNKTGRYNIIY